MPAPGNRVRPANRRNLALLCAAAVLFAPPAALASDFTPLLDLARYGMIVLLFGPAILVIGQARRNPAAMAFTWGPMCGLLFAPLYTRAGDMDYWTSIIIATVAATIVIGVLVAAVVKFGGGEQPAETGDETQAPGKD